jgi:hypothetical protein
MTIAVDTDPRISICVRRVTRHHLAQGVRRSGSFRPVVA